MAHLYDQMLLQPLILVFKLNRDWGIPDPYFAGGDAALMAGVGQVRAAAIVLKRCTRYDHACVHAAV